MVDLFRQIRTEAGWVGLWRGVGPALARISLVSREGETINGVLHRLHAERMILMITVPRI